MVVLPYKDRLELFSKYLQQLLMESLGKQQDRDGKVANQGITVLGNKGSTDQPSYIQQLRDGLSNFFVIFIEVQRDRMRPSMMVEPKTPSGDFLEGFLLGTRHALFEHNRDSITLTIDSVTAFSVGVLIALFERAGGSRFWPFWKKRGWLNFRFRKSHPEWAPRMAVRLSSRFASTWRPIRIEGSFEVRYRFPK